MRVVAFAQAVPHAGLLPDLRPVPRPRHRPRLAHLSRPQGRALRLFLRAVDDDPVRRQGAGLRGRAWRWSASRGSISKSFIEPFGTLWFIYLLPIFFVVTKLTRSVPVLVDLARSRAALEIAHVQDRLDRDRRVRRAASSISTPATSSRRASSRSPRACRRGRCSRSAGLSRLGAVQRHVSSTRASRRCRSSRSRSA